VIASNFPAGTTHKARGSTGSGRMIIGVKEENGVDSMVKQTFVNLPVEDLERTMAFFSRLGFKFNPQFTDENATCMIINENTFAMLLVGKFFKSFIPGKKISDAKKSTEVLVALSVGSRAEVDAMIKKAVDAGGAEYRKAQD
jgi:predicted lactoylglutathione lyase